MNGYFDPSLQTEVHVVASPVGLGAILSQTNPTTNETQIIAYASRSLTEVESHYSQVITDHKPLETIFANPKCRSSARFEGWFLRLQDYSFTVKYQPRSSNPSDF